MARRRSKKDSNRPGWLAGAVFAALMAIQLISDFKARHPLGFWLAAVGLLVVLVLCVWWWLRAQQRAADRQAEMDRNMMVIDAMTGTEFEHCVARLMRRCGFRRVKVSGGAGDLGADIIGYLPDGRRVVVQCKRFTGTVNSPHVQTFNGTARDVHRADVAMLVTSGGATGPARDLAKRLNIVLVDRDAFATWQLDEVPPIPGWKCEPPEPAANAVAAPAALPPQTIPAQATPAPPATATPSAPAPPAAAPEEPWWASEV